MSTHVRTSFGSLSFPMTEGRGMPLFSFSAAMFSGVARCVRLVVDVRSIVLRIPAAEQPDTS